MRSRFAIAVLAVVAIGMAGCSASSRSTKPQPSSTTTTIADASHGARVIAGTATGTSPCEVAAPGDAKRVAVVHEHGDVRGMPVQEPLTQSERAQLGQQVALARTVAQRFPTVRDAQAGGYVRSTPFVPCVGAHYTNFGFFRSFDPAHPSQLLYDGNGDDARIIGLSYLVKSPSGEPSGFAGNNDHWHRHLSNGGLCVKDGVGIIGGEALSKADCAKRGGHKRVQLDMWMLHAWVVPGFECSWGTFSGECPELGGQLCGTAWDAPDPNAPKCGAA